MISALKSLLKQSAVYALGDLFSRAVAFILVPIYTQNMTTAEYGILSIATTLQALLLMTGSLSLPGTLSRFYVDVTDEEERKRLVSTLSGAIALFMLVLSMLMEVASARFGVSFFDSIPYSPYLRIMVWSAFLESFSLIPLTVLRIREESIPYSLFVNSRSVLRIILTIYLVVIMGDGVFGALMSFFYINVIFLIPSLYILMRHISLKVSHKWLRAALIFTAPLIPYQFSKWALNVIDRAILEQFVELTLIGIYSLGYQIARVISIIVRSVNVAWSPFIFNRHKEEGADVLTGKLSTYFVLVMAFITLGVSLSGRYAVYLLADPSYSEASSVIYPVAIGFFFEGLYLIPLTSLLISKKTGLIGLFSTLAALFNIVFNIIMIPRVGYMAAAWATAASYFLLFLGLFWASHKARFIIYEYRRVALIFILMLLFMTIDYYLNLPLWQIGLASRLAILGLFPTMLALFGFFSPDEIRTIKHLIRNAPDLIKERLEPPPDTEP